jgi:hypothetical protein
MKLRLSHKKQIKTNYETIFSIDSMLNDKIIKKSLKNNTKNNHSQLGLTC